MKTLEESLINIDKQAEKREDVEHIQKKKEISIKMLGDGACDLAILKHLIKSQIKQMAIGIGIPKKITQKKSSGDLYANEAWEDTMGLTYEQLDQVLSGLDKGYRKKI